MLRFKINRKLPLEFQKWLSLEQFYYENPILDEEDQEFQKAIPLKFRPHQGNRFVIPYIEIPRENIFCLKASPPQKILDIIYPNSKTVRFFFHPLMKNLFANAKIGQQFYGTPTASFRTMLVWDRNLKYEPIMLKLHLSRVIAAADRSISQSRLKQSTGITAALNGIAADELNAAHLGYFPECLSLLERKRKLGLIIRDPVPKPESKSKGAFLMPLFSLYGRGSHQKPLIVRLIKASDLSPEEYLLSYIIEPLIKGWTYLTLSQGLLPQPHAQNLLLEMGKDGYPTKRIILRDFEGFSVDYVLRGNRGLSNKYFSIGKESDFYADDVTRYFRITYLNFLSIEVFELLVRSLAPFFPRIKINGLLKRIHKFLINTIQKKAPVSIRNRSLMEIYELFRNLKYAAGGT